MGNVGVTPGQVGIGLSGGHHIEVRENLMFSDAWADSNIAFYSADYGSGGCTNHLVQNNRANWTNRDGIKNSFWAGGSCAPGCHVPYAYDREEPVDNEKPAPSGMRASAGAAK